MGDPNFNPTRHSQSFVTQSIQHSESKDALEKSKSAAISAREIAGKTCTRVLTGAPLLTGSAIALLAKDVLGSVGQATAAVVSLKDEHKATTLDEILTQKSPVTVDSAILKDKYVSIAIQTATRLVDVTNHTKIMGLSYAEIAGISDANYEVEILNESISGNNSHEPIDIQAKRTLGSAIGILMQENPNAEITYEMLYRKQAELYKGAAEKFQQDGNTRLAKGALAMVNAFNDFVENPLTYDSMDYLQKIQHAKEFARSTISEPPT